MKNVALGTAKQAAKPNWRAAGGSVILPVIRRRAEDWKRQLENPEMGLKKK